MRWRQRFSIGMAFPLFAVCVPPGRSPDDSVDELEPIAELVNDRFHRAEVERRLARVLLPTDGTETFGAASPGLYRILDEPLPYDRLGPRARRILRSRGFRTWRDIAVVTPLDIASLDGTGVVLRQIADAAVHDSIDALLPGEPVRIEVASPTQDAFGDESARSYLEDLKLTRQLLSSASTVGDLTPELALYKGNDPLPQDLLPTRLQGRLKVATWRELLQTPMRDLLGTRNVGLITICELLSSVREALDEARLPLEETDLVESRIAFGLLSELGSWVLSERDGTQVSDILRPVEPEVLPPRLQDTWRRLSGTSLAALGARPLAIGSLTSELLNVFDPRARRALRDRLWAFPRRATLEKLAEIYGISRERVRQIEETGADDLRSALDSDHFRPISDRAWDIRVRLGAAVPVTSPALEATRCWATRDVEDGDYSDAWELLSWLAGPYKEEGGWLVLREGGPDSRGRDLRARADAAGLLTVEIASELLTTIGIRPEWQEAWIERCGHFRPTGTGWTDASGSTLEQVVRHLRGVGVPMSVEEILHAIDCREVSAPHLRVRLYQDPRVVRVNMTEIGLREWGGAEYTTIVDKMVEEIERAGGSIALDVLTERLVDAFDISPRSVKHYASRPMFALGRPRGHVSLRNQAVKPYELRDDLSDVPGCYELSPTTAAWRVRVDSEVLRGSGRKMPEQLAGWLGLRPGDARMLASCPHALRLSWPPWGRATIGSLRLFASQLGARLDDWLILVFDRSGSLEFRLPVAEDGEPLAHLAAMVGLVVGAGEKRSSLLARLAGAFQVEPIVDESLPARIRAAIENRGDIEIADLAESALVG